MNKEEKKGRDIRIKEKVTVVQERTWLRPTKERTPPASSA